MDRHLPFDDLPNFRDLGGYPAPDGRRVRLNPRLRAYYESAGYTVVGEQRVKDGGLGSPYAVTLLEKYLAG